MDKMKTQAAKGSSAKAKASKKERSSNKKWPSTREQKVEVLKSLSTVTERMDYIRDNTPVLGKDGITVIEKDVRALQCQLARHAGTRIHDKDIGSVGRRILAPLFNYIYQGIHFEEAVRLALAVVRLIDVPTGDLETLFTTCIGCPTCCVDHYRRVDVTLNEIERERLSEDGRLDGYATLLIARGILKDHDDIPSKTAPLKVLDCEFGTVPTRDTDALLRVRGRIINRLAKIVETTKDPDMVMRASSIVLGYVGSLDLDKALAQGTHALIAPHLAQFSHLDTYDGCLLAEQSRWCCRRLGIDVDNATDGWSTRAQRLALAITRSICDEHERDLACGRLGDGGWRRPPLSFDDALRIARDMVKRDWDEFEALVSGLTPESANDAYGQASERVTLSRLAIAEVCSHVLEERTGSDGLLCQVLELALQVGPSTRYRDGRPVVAYLYDYYGLVEGRHKIEERVTTGKDWWLAAFDELAVTRSLSPVARDALSRSNKSREFLDFATICAISRVIGDSFAVEYICQLHARIEKRRGYTYGSIPNDVGTFLRMTESAFCSEESREELAALTVSLIGTPDQPSAQIIALELRECPITLMLLLSVGWKRMGGDVFNDCVIQAFGADAALQKVYEQVMATHKDNPVAMSRLKGLARSLGMDLSAHVAALPRTSQTMPGPRQGSRQVQAPVTPSRATSCGRCAEELPQTL